MSEKILGIVTGSNYPNLLLGNLVLAASGFKGEYHTGDQSLMIKTHYPTTDDFKLAPTTASKAIVLVRNPFDAIVSLFHLKTTNTHSLSVINDFPKEFS